MHPAFSVIFFTVSSGAGFGLFALLVIADLAGLGGGLRTLYLVGGGMLSLVMIAAGLMSSVFHLANPKNAWRAFSRFRTSWLSREGVFAMGFFPLALIYLALTWLQIDSLEWLRVAFALAALALAWITIFSTAMIYACLKTIRQWNTPLVPASYVLLGHFSGAMLLLLLAQLSGAALLPYLILVSMLLVSAAFIKGIYYFWIAKPSVASTINTATGFTRARVRLLDAGHTHGTFLTDEFGFVVARRYVVLLRSLFFVLAFVVPAAIIAGAFGDYGFTGLALAAAFALVGTVVERWLFFAEARHVVNLFHGLQAC